MKRTAAWMALLLCAMTIETTRANAQPSNAMLSSSLQTAAPAGSTFVWEDPAHLLANFAFTPALEAHFIRFIDGSGRDVAAALVVATQSAGNNPSGLYPHDYRTCQSIHAARLDDIQPYAVQGGHFQLLEMSRATLNEKATSLVVRDWSGQFHIDSRLFSELYTPGLPGVQWSLQIWSEDATTTQTMVSSLLTALGTFQPLVFENAAPRVDPLAHMRSLSIVDDELVIEATTEETSLLVDVTIVSWTYPDPTPVVDVVQKALLPGSTWWTLPIPGGTTDVEVFLGHGGLLHDKVLTSFNAWGDLTSNWFPFNDGLGSAAAITRPAVGSLMEPLVRETEANSSIVRLDATLVAGGFVGMYVDLLPAQQAPADLSAFESMVFRARTDAPALQAVDVKLESGAGSVLTYTVDVDDDWGEFILDLDQFAGTADVLSQTRRIVIAATAPAQSFSIEVDRLSFRRPPDPPAVPMGGGWLLGLALIVSASRLHPREDPRDG